MSRLSIGLLVCFVLSYFHGISQISGFGFQPKQHFARQINILQTVSKNFARTTDQILSKSGIDLFVDYDLGQKWKIRMKLGYESKGFSTNHVDFLESGGHFEFNYVATDLNVIRYWGQGKKVQPYNFAGLSLGYLVNQKTWGPPLYDPTYHGPSYPKDYDSFSAFNFSYVFGFGLSFDQVMWLEFERNGDLIPSYRSEDLNIRNVVTSISVGINLLKLFKSI